MDHSHDLRALRCFVAVADDLHFSRAARRLRMPQPALSHQIRRLERTLGFALFERTSRRVTLTDAGRSFAETARLTLAELERGLARARRTAAGELGELTVGYVAPAMLSFLPDLIHRFRARYPGVRLHLSETSTAPQLEALRTGGLDVGFVSDPPPDAELECAREWSEPFVLVLPAGHPLAAKRRLTRAALRTLARDPFVLIPRAQTPHLYDRLVATCASYGLVPDVVQLAPSWHMIVGLASAGLGVGFVPASLRACRAPQARYVDLPRDFAGSRIALCARAGLAPPAARAFVDFARAAVSS